MHTPSGYSLFPHCSFDSTELHSTKNKLDGYRGKDFMEKFCKDFKKHATKIINYQKKKEMMPLTDKENKSYEKQKSLLHMQKII